MRCSRRGSLLSAVVVLAAAAAVPAGAAGDRIVAPALYATMAAVLDTSGAVAGAVSGSPMGFSRDGSVGLDADGHVLTVRRGASVWHLGGRSPYASLSPDGTQIVFAHYGCAACDHVDNPMEIFVAEVRTGKIRRLTFNETYDGDPAWSPDGRLIVFTNDDGLVTMNPRGGERRQLTWGGWSQNPRWSPDGTQLAYLSLDVCSTCFTAHEPWEVWVMDVGTRKTRRISGKGYGPPVWLPR